MGTAIKHKNKARCKNCGTVVESKFRHDFVTCDCFDANDSNTRGFFLDGGLDYQRFGGNIGDIDWIYEPILSSTIHVDDNGDWDKTIEQIMDEYETALKQLSDK